MSEEITLSDSRKYYKFGNIDSHVCQISFGPVVQGFQINMTTCHINLTLLHNKLSLLQ